MAALEFEQDDDTSSGTGLADPVDPLVMHGLKDHNIAQLVNLITLRLHLTLPNMPQCLREIVRGAVIEALEANELRLDE